ncbi:MAG TPA: MFS transporter, partial [Actinomycetes bacterium]|nr:MFS transporter [Actinomycetes bacterium]
LVLALAAWRRRPVAPDAQPERFRAALVAGGRYIRHSRVVRRLLLRSLLFVVPGTVVWALLALVASRRLGLGPGGYGLLLAALGVGAIAGALALPRLRGLASTNGIVLLASLVYAAALLVVALVDSPAAVTIVLFAAGAAWLAVLANLNATMQLFLPGWVRARGLSTYQIVFVGGQGVAALVWGVLAEQFGLVAVFLAAAALMLAGAVSLRWWPLHDIEGMDRSQAMYWPEPHLDFEPEADDGPVLVTVTYRVPEDREARFLEAMESVRRSRQRTGASRWDLYRDGADRHQFVETFVVPSWAEHLRQHGERLTGTDQALEERAVALADGAPRSSTCSRSSAAPDPAGAGPYNSGHVGLWAVWAGQPGAGTVLPRLRGAAADRAGAGSGGTQGRHRPLLRPGRVHRPLRPGRPRGRAGPAGALPRPAAA